MKSAAALTLACLLVACGDDDGAGPFVGDDPSIPQPGTPILDRDSTKTYACEVLDAPVEIAGGSQNVAIAAVNGAPLVAHSGWETLEGGESTSVLAVTPATFSPPGLGDEIYRTTSSDVLYSQDLAAFDGGALLAWAVSGEVEQRIMLVKLDSAGDAVGAPVAVAPMSSGLPLQIVAWENGAQLLSGQTLHVINGQGAPVADTVALTDARISGAALARIDGGTAAVWTTFEGDIGVYLDLLDESGAVANGPLRISHRLPAYTSVSSPAVIAADDEILVAWTEAFRQEFEEGKGAWGHSIVRVARVSGDGERVLAFESLQAVEEGIIHLQPAFVALGDAVLLTWSRGTFIPICGGCRADNTRRLIVLEPHDLVSRSESIEMEGEITGFSDADMAEVGDVLVHLLTLDFHALSSLALARTRCSAL